MHNNTANNQETEFFYGAVASLADPKQAQMLFEDICTPQEIMTIAQRLAVAQLLRRDKVYADIAKITGASTATISRVRRSMEQSRGGYDIVLGGKE